MSEDEKNPESSGSGNFFFLLRWWANFRKQSDFAARTGIPASEINRFEQDKQKPQAATVRKLIEGAGVSERLVEFLRWCYRLMRQARSMDERVALPPSQPRPSSDLQAAAWEAVERSLAMAQAECRLRQRQVGDRPGPSVEELFETLSSFSFADQRLLLEASLAYRDPLLCIHFCRESESAAANDPTIAMKLAETALLIACYVPEVIRPRAQGWSTGFIGNVHRVIGSDFAVAERSFAQAWRHWKLGEDPTGLFSEAYLLDLEASLHRAQRRFAHALKLQASALRVARPDEVGTILLNTAGTLQQQGNHEEALRVLARAAKAIDGERQPRLLYGAVFNRASNLLLLGRTEEAAPLVPEVRLLADRLGNGIDGIRTTWLEANCASGLGRREEALAKLEEVRQAFAEKPLPFDYALASLDVILLYREENRFAEIKVLAAEILEFFKAKKVHREAIAAVLLFQEAAEQEKVTAGLVQRLKTYLSETRRRPGVRFEG
ncbi:MAG: helix-turn-helix domain-containing protein [Acidobacteriota bacterium]